MTRRRALWVGAGALAVAGSGVAWWQLFSGDASVRTLAVLPLANTQGDPDLEYLCDGITESLIQQVSKLRSFRVRPLGIVLDFKGSAGDPQARADSSAWKQCSPGTIERQVPRLRISARLVDVASGRQLWANTYDREEADAARRPGRDCQRDHGRWPARAIDDQRA